MKGFKKAGLRLRASRALGLRVLGLRALGFQGLRLGGSGFGFHNVVKAEVYRLAWWFQYLGLQSPAQNARPMV